MLKKKTMKGKKLTINLQKRVCFMKTPDSRDQCFTQAKTQNALPQSKPNYFKNDQA
jgi:hypothetical protein